MSSQTRVFQRLPVAALTAIAVLLGSAVTPAAAKMRSVSDGVLEPPYAWAYTSQDCRQYDDLYGPGPLRAPQSLVCDVSQSIDARSGLLAGSVDAAPEARAGTAELSALRTNTAREVSPNVIPDVRVVPSDPRLARGDAFPNSVILALHRLTKSTPALRYTFRFEVATAEASVSNAAEAYASLMVLGTVRPPGCDCETQSGKNVIQAMDPLDGHADNSTVDVAIEVRPKSGRISPGTVYLFGHLVPFGIVARPPLQMGNTAPSPGWAHAAGTVRLSQIAVEMLPF